MDLKMGSSSEHDRRSGIIEIKEAWGAGKAQELEFLRAMNYTLMRLLLSASAFACHSTIALNLNPRSVTRRWIINTAAVTLSPVLPALAAEDEVDSLTKMLLERSEKNREVGLAPRARQQ